MPSSRWNQSGLAVPCCGRGYLLAPTLWLLILRPILLQNLSGMGWDSASMSAAVSPPPAARSHDYQPTPSGALTPCSCQTLLQPARRAFCLVLSLGTDHAPILKTHSTKYVYFSQLVIVSQVHGPQCLPDGCGGSGCHESSFSGLGSLRVARACLTAPLCWAWLRGWVWCLCSSSSGRSTALTSCLTLMC